MQICTVIRFLFKLHLLLAIVWLVSACGTEENRGTGNYGLVGLVIQADHYLMKAGDVLHVTFRIENGAKDVRVFESANTPVLDIVINSGPTWSVENPDKVQHRLELKPGETVELNLTWIVPADQSLERRQLSVSGRLDQNSRSIAGATIYVCVKTCDPYH